MSIVKNLIFILLISLILNIKSDVAPPQPINVKCYYVHNWAVFDLNKLSSET